MAPQIVTGLAGLWLVVSAFLWHQSSFQRQNSIICGTLAMVLSVACVRYHEGVFLGSLLAMWLCLSAILQPTLEAATALSDILAAIAIGTASIASGCRRQAGRT
jgi:hypothetical protein